MSRRYREPIEVRRAVGGDQSADLPASEQPPRSFRWQRRRYEVTAVISHWIESGSWWGGARESLAEDLADELPTHEIQYWRVEARERGGSLGVYDLCHNPRADSWELTRSWD